MTTELSFLKKLIEFWADLRAGFVKCDAAQILEPGDHLKFLLEKE